MRPGCERVRSMTGFEPRRAPVSGVGVVDESGSTQMSGPSCFPRQARHTVRRGAPARSHRRRQMPPTPDGLENAGNGFLQGGSELILRVEDLVPRLISDHYRLTVTGIDGVRVRRAVPPESTVQTSAQSFPPNEIGDLWSCTLTFTESSSLDYVDSVGAPTGGETEVERVVPSPLATTSWMTT